MAGKDKGTAKPDRGKSAAIWRVRLRDGHDALVSNAHMRRNADQSYTFTRDGEIVFDVPPGGAICVARDPVALRADAGDSASEAPGDLP